MGTKKGQRRKTARRAYEKRRPDLAPVVKSSGVVGDQDTVDDTLEILEDVATGQIGIEEALETLLHYFGAT